ncbi:MULTISPECIES: hypothetical protein [Pseudoalteromonas]|uniref:Uncharacterized protein n=1 Tax=Pseudoalteromonas maricaloris TaxID=184924 RepID=A0A8I2KP72_9GAMM|nr:MULTISPECIES: hypothetical protein [Pseudoalteromonas]KJZ02858.1 hypothetical protein TW73_10775 [Pseudoalteromonas piscicida]NLR20497.1 hypothetical protein [Pseudoalteromonas maricaloris]QZO11276.1 hypothetical protein K5642_08930 [Pseudoalteromonas piscicida]RZG15170.1 hypothetical protein EXT47_10500 [Pseudoalteromonas sp. CO342X]WOX30013.1 hypothetical protein R5H13_07020 [Pseudoalteromonas maricaloris]
MASIEGAITDLQRVNRTDDKGAPLPETAEFKFHTKSPASIWTVKVTNDQMANGTFAQLEKLQSDPNGWGLKPVLLNLEYYEGANVARQMEWKGFRLNSIAPQQAK